MTQLPGFEVVRATSQPTIEVVVDRAAPDAQPTMDVRFSAFGNWYEINSVWEGRFLERTEKGAFSKTIRESGDRVKVLFNHGFDPQIGQKVLGTVSDLREDADAAVGEVSLFDTSYVRDLLPGLKAGSYGSSMRMVVVKDKWDEHPARSEANPDGIPERTITEARLLEFGPVTFPANPESTAGVRSATDTYYEHLRSVEPHRVDELARAREVRTPQVEAAGSTTVVPDGAARTTTDEPGSTHSGGLTPAQRRERIFNLTKGTS